MLTHFDLVNNEQYFRDRSWKLSFSACLRNANQVATWGIPADWYTKKLSEGNLVNNWQPAMMNSVRND